MGISSYEKQYIAALRKIYNDGFADGTNERTGIATKRIPGVVFQVDLKEELPILKSKQVFVYTALKEILWIWQCQSNNINDLDAHIWDDWADANGSIGAAYGDQVRKPVCIYTDPVHKTPESFRAYENQTKYILEYLREFPNGRWANATLWNVDDLAKMNLVPCCHTVTWNLDGGRLNCVLDQRSGDMPIGVPFDSVQYAMLTMLFARDLGVEPGIFTHVIADAHIYAGQMEGVKEQLLYYDVMEAVDCKVDESAIEKIAKEAALYHNSIHKEHEIKTDASIIEDAREALSTDPVFAVNDSKDFFEVEAKYCQVVRYKHMGKIDFGKVAV